LSPFEEKATAKGGGDSAQQSRWVQDDFFGASYGEGMVVLVIFVGAIIAARKLVPRLGDWLNQRFNPFGPVPLTSPQHASAVVQQARFSDFVAGFRVGPTESRRQPSQNDRQKEAEPVETFSTDPLAEFFPFARKELGAGKGLLSAMVANAEAQKRREVVLELCAHITAIKSKATSRALRPVWQMSSCLEGLLNQLAERSSQVTPSTLRTVAGALDLLEMLCVPGLKPDLGDNPPARFLCVDDDAISRRAICMALQKAFQSATAAENGHEALQLASENTYDVVFLDIEMPGMDGFEVCTRLHGIDLNRRTPVVFVTAHSDFRSRAKSLTAGGRDLLAKPFLSFEIAVKALTLLLRNRLQATSDTANGSGVRGSDTRRLESESSPGQDNNASAEGSNVPEHGDCESPQDLGVFAELHAAVSALGQAKDRQQRQELLGDIYVVLHSITAEAEHGGPKVVGQLSAAMGKLVRKLLENPSIATESAFETLAGALNLLEESFGADDEFDLSSSSTRVLVVDDDPTSRLALSNAIQLTFSRPETAGSGDTALALGESNPYDVIFLDVVMPGMDGFAACAGIRKTIQNGATPVVFVTNQISAAAKKKATASGGTAFLSKPPLAAEIVLIAMTLALRKRKETAERNLNPC
jgi:CheY-like chemotaxis protein